MTTSAIIRMQNRAEVSAKGQCVPYVITCRYMFDRGLGVPEDKVQAAKWYRRAADQISEGEKLSAAWRKDYQKSHQF